MIPFIVMTLFAVGFLVAWLVARSASAEWQCRLRQVREQNEKMEREAYDYRVEIGDLKDENHKLRQTLEAVDIALVIDVARDAGKEQQ